MDIAAQWGRNIAAQRRARGLSQADLARALDISPGAVWNWENGRSVPTDIHRIRIARAMSCPASVLFPYPAEVG